MKNVKYYLRKYHLFNDEGYTDKPRRWNCCNALVSPKDLGQHVKDKHMIGYKIAFN